MTAPFKYRAFLSYSHRDAAWAKWLHKSLEAYSIDKDLIGRETAQGPIPKTLRPIFRDREDFSAGHSLSDQTRAALEASQFLIVLCSPNAARSEYVNEEIRSFKGLRRAAEVIPVIVDGVPGDPERECFPPAVRFTLGEDGTLTSEREEPIAADVRPEGDGKEIAKQKIVAGLLGVGLDEIMRRGERARKRRNLYRTGAGVAAILAMIVGYVGWSWAVGFSSRLDSSQWIGVEADGAALCQHTLSQAEAANTAEDKRIALATKCVRVLSYDIVDLSQNARVPKSFVWSFEADVGVLKKFSDAGKLTQDQFDVLTKGEALVAQLKELCGTSHSDGTKTDGFGLAC